MTSHVLYLTIGSAILLSGSGFLSGCASGQPRAQERVTMIRDVDPRAAHELLTRDGHYRYLDVRTVEEFAQGHAAGAVNIPVSFRDPATGRMNPNPDFLRVVSEHFLKDQPLILGCRSGARSMAASRILTEAGYTGVHNLVGGYAGAFDASGQCTAPGWSTLGLPTSMENGPGVSYESLGGQGR